MRSHESVSTVAVGARRETTELIRAVRKADLTEVRRLLEEGVDVDEPTVGSNTALKIAAKEGHLEVARLLLEAGADVNKSIEQGTTPLMLAAGHGHVAVVQLFLDAGAEVEHRGRSRGKHGPGPTALARAVKHGRLGIVRILEAKAGHRL